MESLRQSRRWCRRDDFPRLATVNWRGRRDWHSALGLLRLHLLSRDIRFDEKSRGTTVEQGNELPPTQAAITFRAFVEAVRVGEGFFLPGQQPEPIPDCTDQNR